MSAESPQDPRPQPPGASRDAKGSQNQGHGHTHDHAHPHDHDHDHAHEHGHGEPAAAPTQGVHPSELVGTARRVEAAPVFPESSAPEGLDDPGSLALSDALRSSFLIVRVLLAGLILYFLVSNVSFVGTHERAIVMRFGKPVMRGGQIEQGPGLVWAYPYPIDQVERIPVTELRTAMSTIGWFAVTPEQEKAGIEPDAGGSLNPATEGYAITGDGNIIHARAIVRYRITEPVKYYFNHRDAGGLITNIVDNALTYAAARYSVDDVLTRSVVSFKETLLKRVTELVVAHDVGVTIEPSDVVAIPPRQVKTEFNAVLNAEQERGQTISVAQGYANRVVNEAHGQSEARINAGRTDRNRLIQAVSSEAQSFSSLLPEYLKNPEFFRHRWQAEAMRRILTNAQQKFPIASRGAGDQLWLHINRDAEPAPKPLPLQ